MLHRYCHPLARSNLCRRRRRLPPTPAPPSLAARRTPRLLHSALRRHVMPLPFTTSLTRAWCWWRYWFRYWCASGVGWVCPGRDETGAATPSIFILFCLLRIFRALDFRIVQWRNKFKQKSRWKFLWLVILYLLKVAMAGLANIDVHFYLCLFNNNNLYHELYLRQGNQYIIIFCLISTLTHRFWYIDLTFHYVTLVWCSEHYACLYCVWGRHFKDKGLGGARGKDCVCKRMRKEVVPRTACLGRRQGECQRKVVVWTVFWCFLKVSL